VCIKEREKDRFLHEVVDAFDGGVEGLWDWRDNDVLVTKKTVSHFTREIDFPW